MSSNHNPTLIDVPPREGQHPLDARTPLLLLPVNLQTRFMDLSNGNPELWVRIYPDQIAVNSHETELTQQEITDGKSYWDIVWRAGKAPDTDDARKAPWRGLASLYGAERAAWIAKQMTPNNLPLQPTAPTADGVPPVPPPDYPSPPTRASSWTRAAQAAALPDAWTVVLVSGGNTTSFKSGPVDANLAVGLTPGGAPLPPGSQVDSRMKWLVDFDTALAAGMAVRIPLTAEQRKIGFDRIFVYGLRANDAAGITTFADLLDAHHYTDGVSLVPQGAPTNNTQDANSEFSRKDIDYEISFFVERGDSLSQDTAKDGAVFAKTIGIDAARVAHIRYADSSGVRNARDMMVGLWPATIGYFLSQMMAGVFSADQIELARQYVSDYVVPRGSIPAFRVGNTPYGVLPVTSLKRYKPDQRVTGGAIEPGLVDFIGRLWPSWLASSAGAPHMQNVGDPDKELVGLLGMDASSMTFRGRQIFGDEFLWNYLTLLSIPPAVRNKWWTDHLVQGRQTLDTFGYNTWDPRVIHLAMAETSFPVSFPTVQSGPLSEANTLNADADLGAGVKGNYIQWLKQASITDLQAENYPGPKPTSLLYKILRQSVILDYVRMATVAELNAGRLQLSQLREAEIIGVQPQPASSSPAAPASLPPVSPWEILARPSGPNPAISWADYLVNLDPQPNSPYARLAELRASLDRLALLSTAELDRLLTETLDACSHRLDVWATGVANAILNRVRSLEINGTHLGCFGWIEEVRPSAKRPSVQGSELERIQSVDRLRSRKLNANMGLAAPQQPAVDNGGFIYAPSQVQASVGAVLRNGYMTHKGTSSESLLSVDLSSERVRKALSLLDGVRQGQSLNALLGYIFEAGLHDLQLDAYAQPFRDRFPIVGSKLTPSSDPSASVAASNVVDGLALRTAWDNSTLAQGTVWGGGLPGPGLDQDKVVNLLKIIDDYADALGDLSISEAVFQIIRGNFGRAGGLLDAISKGIRPPQPDVVNTPRGGLDLTHRVALLFAGNPVIDLAWSSVANHPRAAAEPWLNAWVSRMLPDPSLVLCEVRYKVGGTDHIKQVRLSDLSLGPLDCGALSDASDTPQKSELEYRILYAAGLPPNAGSIEIDYAPGSPPTGTIYFPDFFYLSKSLRSLTGSARALAPQDLTLPEKKAEDQGGAVDLAELRTRAGAAVASLAADVAALQTAIAGLPGGTVAVRSALVRCSYYGVEDAIPLVSSDPDPHLAEQAAKVLKNLQDRSSRAAAVPLATAALADLVSVFAMIFGQGFVVVPRFTPPDFPSLKSAFSLSSALVAGDPVAPSRWFMQLTYVRPAISRLDAGLSLSQVLRGEDGGRPQLLLGQLKVLPSDTWLGLPIDPGKPPDKGRVAFACITQGDPINQSSYAGLLIDEWPERIPSTKENASVAFHYEEPKACAPQSLLLAVCPDNRQFWDDDLILGTLEETLELAKVRTVDLDSVQKVGQLLPALYFALNMKGATVSTNFVSLKESLSAVQIRSS